MVTRARKSAIGYYLIAIAVVFGFMAFTLTPAQANAPVEREPPIIKAPTYPADDPDLIQGASDQVKIGDKVSMTFIDLPVEQLELIRLGEPVRKDEYERYPKPKHEVFKKTFTEDQPSAASETIEYTVPCWALTSTKKEDQLAVQATLFFKDGSVGTSYASLTILDSKTFCPTTVQEPTPDPEFDAYQKDGKKVSTSESPSQSPSTPVAANPTVTVSPMTAQQTGEFLFSIAGLPTDNSTTMTITLASKEAGTLGNPVKKLTENKATHGNPTFPFNWHVPCDVKPGKYAVTVDVFTSTATVPSADSEVFTVSAGNCSTPPPTPDPTPTASQSPTPDPTPTASQSPTPDPTPTASQSVKPDPTPTASQSATPDPTPTASQSVKPDPSTDPSEDTDNPDVTLKLFDDAGNEISSLPRNQRLTIKTTYDGDVDSVAFSLHSKPFDLGNAIVKNGAAQIDFMIPCSFPLGKHEVIAKFAGKAPLIVKKPIVVTAGNCEVTPPAINAGTSSANTPLTPFVSSGTPGTAGPALAQTGTASMLLGVLSLLFAGTGLYLIVSRREQA